MKSLSDSLKTLVTLEREAYGIGTATDASEGEVRFERIERVIVRPGN
jgi:hypothetical protein